MKVSLFPFLPVLLCLMGAMIMLLVLVAWNVREQTFQPVDETLQTLTVEEAEELREKIDMQAEEAAWFAERYVLAQQEVAEELADRQARLALAEKETQKIKEEILRLDQLAGQLDSQTPVSPEEVEYLKRLLAEQQRRKAEAELELAELQKEAAKKEKSYAIVPARGATGTFRRPIYIECRNDKIIIQPEGVELLPGDFVALDRPDNPFDTVLRTIRQYYVETDQIVRGSEPYPLLIVRPSGVEMYENAVTRMANGNWIKDFGYEIVNEDWNIQYPEPNEELRTRMLQQLEIARNRLTGYMIAMQRAMPVPGYGSEYGGGTPLLAGTPGTMPQQFRTDQHGNVVPIGNEIRSAEDLQRVLTARRGGEMANNKESGTERSAVPGQETTDDRRQTVADKKREPTFYVAEEGSVVAREGYSVPGEKPGVDVTLPTVGVGAQPSQNSRPQNWALQGATQYTTGLSRTVRVRCEADRFVLPAQAGLATGRVIPITGSVATAADQLVQAILEFQQSWGSAGENVHWRPILQVRVSPGGEQRFQELKALLKNSGLVIDE